MTRAKSLLKVAKTKIENVPCPWKNRGVSCGKTKEGYVVYTHRNTSKAYDMLKKVPKSVIRSVESTG